MLSTMTCWIAAEECAIKHGVPFMSNEQIEKFLEYLSRDPALQRDLTRRARSPEQFYANAVRAARLFGYGFSADELKTWVHETRRTDLLPFATGNANAARSERPAESTAPASAGTASPDTPAAGNPPHRLAC